ncbi:MAG TPA: recombinase family protein [Verrucomicrobiae bacterium]
MTKLFLYARKSTDVEDKQVLSIDAQINELREFAEREKLTIADELIEKQSAKIPGRPIFNAMLERLEAGEADGILAWHATAWTAGASSTSLIPEKSSRSNFSVRGLKIPHRESLCFTMILDSANTTLTRFQRTPSAACAKKSAEASIPVARLLAI